jgi:[acyl-carrier-protein] S-malonyltransferase
MGITELEQLNTDLYIEMGPGKTLAGMNKRIGTKAQTISIEKVDDLKLLEAIS